MPTLQETIELDAKEASEHGSSTQSPSYARYFTCANVIKDANGKSKNCTKRPSSTCGRCALVKYCSKKCQVDHWPRHREDCNHELLKKDWMPTWHRENRTPMLTFNMRNIQSGYGKFLWGNVPAYDVLQLAKNEGQEYNKDLSLCFGASGDLRNMIMTINGLHQVYEGRCTSLLNDREKFIAARNTILLILALTLSPDEAPETMLHVWYSARLTPKIASRLREKVKPMVADVVQKIQNKNDTTILAKTWTSGNATISVRLYKPQWAFVLKMLETASTVEMTEKRRKYIVLNKDDLDHCERRWWDFSGPLRLSERRFFETGILLPFGHCIDDFTVPNVTLFDPDSNNWMLEESASVRAGYDWNEICVYGGGFVPIHDINGRQFSFVFNMLQEFCDRLQKLSLSFILYQCEASSFSKTISQVPKAEKCFDRIEVSNIADTCHLGLEETLRSFGPMLKRSSENSHATLVMLSQTALLQARLARGPQWEQQQSSAQWDKIMAYRGAPLNNEISIYHPAYIQSDWARALVLDNDEMFDFYWTKMVNAEAIATRTKMCERKVNKIIEKWPICKETDLRKRFLWLLGLGRTGYERYVEWTRKE